MRCRLTNASIGSAEAPREFSGTAPLALRARSAAPENSVGLLIVNDVMALLGVTDVMALET